MATGLVREHEDSPRQIRRVGLGAVHSTSASPIPFWIERDYSRKHPPYYEGLR